MEQSAGAGHRAAPPHEPPAAAPDTAQLAPAHRGDPEFAAALDRLMASARLAGSAQLRKFLAYVCEESLAGRGDAIKAYNIATVALGRSPEFDPAGDPIVRVEATRLRSMLAAYYSDEGARETVRLRIAPGSYRPLIERRAAPTPLASPHLASPPLAVPPLASPPAAARPLASRLALALLALNVAATLAILVVTTNQSATIDALAARIEALSRPAR